MFQKLTIKTKIFIAFMSIGIIPLFIASIIFLNMSDSALTEKAFNQMESIREVKKKHLEDFFNNNKNNMNVLLETVASFRQSAYEKLENTQDIKKTR